jgi:hypothetical protein
MRRRASVSWRIIPKPGATSKEIEAEVSNILWRSTSIVDTFCAQTLRSTVNTEDISGPGAPRMGVQQGTGNGILITRRWPVTEVLAVQTSMNRVFPRQWTLVPPGLYDIEHPLINVATDTASVDGPDGGWKILVAPGFITDRYGRNGLRALVSYTNGWPHTSLTATGSAGAMTLTVDDVTGWAGASGFVYDGGSTEQVAVSSVAADSPLPLPNGAGFAQTGPGTVSLTAPLVFTHTQGVVVSALPANVLWATVLACATQALESGIDSITIQSVSGSESSSGHGVDELQAQYELLLDPFRRVV